MAQNLIGESPRFLAVLDKVSRLAPINRPVLVIGERGTGKELIAQRLHYLSTRWDHPLISLNCSTLSDGLIDSELFGHESGAFTGAKGRHLGRFERAENGTLFLDELATTPLSVQEKLLRVIEYGQYERVGGIKALEANVRLVCATNEDLPALAQKGKFRADLLDRLAFDVIQLPPLRARQDDIALLAEHFAIKMCRELGLPLFVGFTSQAWRSIHEYPWPGNVRELKNVIERAVYQHGTSSHPINTLTFNPFNNDFPSLNSEAAKNPAINAVTESVNADSEGITPAVTPDNDPLQASSTPLPDTLTFPIDFKLWKEEQAVIVIRAALEQAQYNQRTAAKMLSLSYDQLRGLVRKHKLI
ncbi:phage shock protein operon transcriptional activator [Vibrio methylphosphonaticus]|uniref:phage shock protein operon transcriptional activator n=1 Tax=Vibrio methylphosphonaticus TaxID=2946866 RepID=UPI00202A46A0|nr:phage shock protein operon transcriptional activator [Vibrio methylphosphonaticus]MCL9775889.1 phage shock protein operon transcriptional activator [Vibrio methylphosphonaticus]